MMMNEAKSNMYSWCSHTWNPIRGTCSFSCKYCFMKRFPLGPLRLDERELSTDLGKGHVIFIGSSCDMFANNVPKEWVFKVLEYCRRFPDNTYVFQSKNPEAFIFFRHDFPCNTLLGITLESNRDLASISLAPSPEKRIVDFANPLLAPFRKFINIEPVLELDVEALLAMIWRVKPVFVSIGSDSKGHHLSEPSKEKIFKLIGMLNESGIEVRVKDNLRRLTNG